MSCVDVVSHRWFNFDLRQAGAKDESSSDSKMEHDGQIAGKNSGLF